MLTNLSGSRSFVVSTFFNDWVVDALEKQLTCQSLFEHQKTLPPKCSQSLSSFQWKQNFNHFGGVPPFNVIRRRKSCMLLCGGTAKILKEFASLLFTWSLIRKVCFECVWMFWISEYVCLIIFFKMIGLWSQVNNLYLISWSPTLMNSHTSSEGTEAPIIYFVHLSFVSFLCFWLKFLFVFSLTSFI